ncbi:NAC domain-containing protein 1-like [Cannabis sativa]|nr:NAC domain-containing protein 1-like [Cannabis sativa]
MIHHANIYTSQPSLLADSYEGFEREKVKEWYFFSPRVCKNGIRATRKAHLGFWRMSQSAKPIQHNGIDIGLKSVLNFHMESNKKSIKTEWIMHEYIIIDDNNDSNNSKNDFALCKIYKNPKKYKSNKDEEQQLQSEVLGAQNQQEELQTTDEQQQYYHHQQSQPQPQSQPFICNDHYQPQPQSESCSYNNVYNQPQSQLCTNEELLSHNDHYQLQLQQQQ